MAEAVTSFISGAVPAVALWVLFDVTIRQKLPGGAAASTPRPSTLRRPSWAAGRRATTTTTRTPKIINALIQAWAETNDYLLSHTDEALVALQKNHYQQVPLPDLKEQLQGVGRATRHGASAHGR